MMDIFSDAAKFVSFQEILLSLLTVEVDLVSNLPPPTKAWFTRDGRRSTGDRHRPNPSPAAVKTTGKGIQSEKDMVFSVSFIDLLDNAMEKSLSMTSLSYLSN